MQSSKLEQLAVEISACVAQCVANALKAAFPEAPAPTVSVEQYMRSEFGHIVTLNVVDEERIAPIVDLEDDNNADAVGLDPVHTAESWFINVYRLLPKTRGDRLGSNGYVLGKKAFRSAEEAYRRRKGRCGKDWAYEGVVEVGARIAARLGYKLA